MDPLKPRRRTFVAAGDRPPAELVARQMKATALAFRVLGAVDAVRAFLNDVDERLGGRPLDVAGASAEGLERVSAALAALAHPLSATD